MSISKTATEVKTDNKMGVKVHTTGISAMRNLSNTLMKMQQRHKEILLLVDTFGSGVNTNMQNRSNADKTVFYLKKKKKSPKPEVQ